VQVEDNDAVDAWFPNRHRAAALIDRLERHPVAVAASLLVTVLGITGLIFFGIPAAAERVAQHIPASVARAMGEQTAGLLGRFGFDKSGLPQKQRDHLAGVFSAYVADLPDPARYQLRFLKSQMPNAFALPGGIIVITDEMVRVIGVDASGSGGSANSNSSTASSAHDDDDDDDDDKQDSMSTSDSKQATVATTVGGSDEATSRTPADERFLAVVAHEIGHEEHRHVLRSVLQSSAIVLVGAYFTGDVSSASALVVSVPTFLLHSHYSREFEADADAYAFTSLAAHGISPGRFAEVMMQMQRADPHFRHETGYLSTHPQTLDRIMSAQAAAAKFRGDRGQ